MPEPVTLDYVVENATLATVNAQTTFNGSPATVAYQRARIEALPKSGDGPTFTMELDPAFLAQFPEGSEITVTVTPATPSPTSSTGA